MHIIKTSSWKRGCIVLIGTWDIDAYMIVQFTGIMNISAKFTFMRVHGREIGIKCYPQWDERCKELTLNSVLCPKDKKGLVVHKDILTQEEVEMMMKSILSLQPLPALIFVHLLIPWTLWILVFVKKKILKFENMWCLS